MKLCDLKFGKTDAFNELKEYGADWFKKAFFIYSKYKMDDFIDGKSYYICGEKGTGKTAFLRYLQCVLEEDENNLIIPIRFKSDLDSEDKKALIRASANVRETIAEGWEEFKDSSDAVIVWQVYIINKLFVTCEEVGEYHFFEDTKELNQIRKLLKIVYPDYKERIVPQIKGGQLNVETSLLKMLDAKLQLEIGYKNKNENINFNRIAKTIVNRFSRLRYDRNRAYIIFDELELSVRSQKEHQRDIKLVRDLIIAIDKLNEICKLNGMEIYTLASIRTEVIKSVYTAGYEINKCIEDYGIIISWYQRGGNYESNQLLKIIENKIIACEDSRGISNHGDVWEKYFPKFINGVETKRYILNYSWMHPRDIVRLMNGVTFEGASESKFTQEMFDRAMKKYSSSSWIEIVEGLRLKYSEDDIAALKLILNNVEVPFTYQYLSLRIEKMAEIDDRVLHFKKNQRLRNVLDDLFEYGVIGNTGQRMIFKFMEDDDLAVTEDMIIHKPLRNFFAVKSRPNQKMDVYEELQL